MKSKDIKRRSKSVIFFQNELTAELMDVRIMEDNSKKTELGIYFGDVWINNKKIKNDEKLTEEKEVLFFELILDKKRKEIEMKMPSFHGFIEKETEYGMISPFGGFKSDRPEDFFTKEVMRLFMEINQEKIIRKIKTNLNLEEQIIINNYIKNKIEK